MASQEELDRLKEIRDLERELAGIRSETLNDVRDISNFLSDRFLRAQPISNEKHLQQERPSHQAP